MSKYFVRELLIIKSKGILYPIKISYPDTNQFTIVWVDLVLNLKETIVKVFFSLQILYAYDSNLSELV